MNKYIIFHEVSGQYLPSRSLVHGYKATLHQINIGKSMIHTTQMALFDFDNMDKGYINIIAFDNLDNTIKNPFVAFLPDSSIGSKDIRRGHNLLRMYTCGFMSRHIDNMEDRLCAQRLDQLIKKLESIYDK